MQRLPNTPEGETKPIGFRLPPPMLAMIDREVNALRAASPEGASVTRSTALRALLVELEQRRAADPANASRAPLPRASLARIVAAVEGAGAELRGLLEDVDGVEEVGGGGEIQRRRQERRTQEQVGQPRGAAAKEGRPAVLHTAAAGQLSLLTPTANDAAPASRPSRPSESAEELAALKPRLVAAVAAGHSARGIGAAAGVDAASITRWLSGARPGVSLASAHKLAAHLASIGF